MSFTALTYLVVILVLFGLYANKSKGNRLDLVGMPEMPDLFFKAAILVFATFGMLGVALGPAR